MKVYLDNAATTSVDAEVFAAMTPWLTQGFGNPSSTHSFGREAKGAIEMSRKKIADLLHVTPGEIFFTSGGTEADNTILNGAVAAGFNQAYTSPLEHHAVLHTLEHLEDSKKINLSLAEIDVDGTINLSHLESFLKANHGALVSLMHANNEIGNLLDLNKVADLVEAYKGYFHSDTVQAMGHYKHNLKECKAHAVVCSAHKIHGPKGVGFMYLRKDKRISSYILGGGQERNMRGGTENVAGIVGLAKAFEMAYQRMDEDEIHIRKIKNHMISGLKNIIPGIQFNGRSAENDSLYTVLNVLFPPSPENDFLLFNLDMKGIAASGGSACNSGADKGSHVLQALGIENGYTGVRFSFCKKTTIEEIDYTLTSINELINQA